VTDLVEVLATVAEKVADRADELNRLDAQAGDGDLGVTATNASKAIVALLPSLCGKELPEILRDCGMAISREAPSTAGTLIATGLLGASRAAADSSSSGAETLARLLEASQAAIAARGKAELGSKTMLDALAPAAAAANKVANEGGTASQALRAAADAAEKGAAATATMAPRFGRAAWLADRSAGHEDAGARLIAIILAVADQSNDSSGGPG
jgi:dihydroxyacetone kinase-like protein